MCVCVCVCVCVCGENVLEQQTVGVKTQARGGASQARAEVPGLAAPG